MHAEPSQSTRPRASFDFRSDRRYLVAGASALGASALGASALTSPLAFFGCFAFLVSLTAPSLGASAAGACATTLARVVCFTIGAAKAVAPDRASSDSPSMVLRIILFLLD